MTLTEVLERAAEMTAADRWAVYTQCGIHDFKVLMRTRTGGNPSPPYYCPVCLTVFSPISHRMWNPPSKDFTSAALSIQKGIA